MVSVKQGLASKRLDFTKGPRAVRSEVPV